MRAILSQFVRRLVRGEKTEFIAEPRAAVADKIAGLVPDGGGCSR